MKKKIKKDMPPVFIDREKQAKKLEIERLAGIINRRLDFFRIVKG